MDYRILMSYADGDLAYVTRAAKWLMQWIGNPLGCARTGSNPVDCAKLVGTRSGRSDYFSEYRDTVAYDDF